MFDKKRKNVRLIENYFKWNSAWYSQKELCYFLITDYRIPLFQIQFYLL